MLQSQTGSLVLIDVNTNAPGVFWRGRKIAVEGVAVFNKKVTLRVLEGVVPLDLMAELLSANVEVKGVKK